MQHFKELVLELPLPPPPSLPKTVRKTYDEHKFSCEVVFNINDNIDFMDEYSW